LALMEKRLGPFARRLVDASPLAGKYFHRDGRVRVADLSESSWQFVRKTGPLRDFFDVSPGDAHCGIVELVGDLLALDPQQR